MVINIATNFSVPNSINQYLESKNIEVCFDELSAQELDLIETQNPSIWDQLLINCVDSGDSNRCYLVHIDDDNSFKSVRPTELVDAEDGFCVQNSAVINKLYEENILHELLHLLVNAEDCYLANLEPHPECDNESVL